MTTTRGVDVVESRFEAMALMHESVYCDASPQSLHCPPCILPPPL